MSKQIFFKTVRSDGTSVWAPPPLARKYEIGKKYKFPEKLPAHVFIRKTGLKNNFNNFIDVYKNRREPVGSRVLICLGYKKEKYVPCFGIDSKKWFEKDIKNETILVEISNNFEVIGEIFVPQSWIYGESPKPNIRWIPLKSS